MNRARESHQRNKKPLVFSVSSYSGQKPQVAAVIPVILVAARPHPSRLLRLPFRSRRDHNDNIRDDQRRGSTPDKMAILIRSDVYFTPARVAEMAASIAVRLFQRVCWRQSACSAWNATGQRKVILSLEGEERALRIIDYAQKHGVAVTGIRVNHKQRLKVSQSDSEAPWVAVGIFGPHGVIDRLTKGLLPM